MFVIDTRRYWPYDVRCLPLATIPALSATAKYSNHQKNKLLRCNKFGIFKTYDMHSYFYISTSALSRQFLLGEVPPRVENSHQQKFCSDGSCVRLNKMQKSYSCNKKSFQLWGKSSQRPFIQYLQRNAKSDIPTRRNFQYRGLWPKTLKYPPQYASLIPSNQECLDKTLSVSTIWHSENYRCVWCTSLCVFVWLVWKFCKTDFEVVNDKTEVRLHYRVSQKSPPAVFWHFFQTVRNF